MYVDGAKNNPVQLLLALLLLQLAGVADSGTAPKGLGPASEFAKHQEVRPKFYHGVSGEGIGHTRDVDKDLTTMFCMLVTLVQLMQCCRTLPNCCKKSVRY